MSRHVFGDESKRRDLVLVAGAVVPGSLSAARRHIKDLYLPGQHGIHMVKEHRSRQRRILQAIAELEVDVTVYVADKRSFSNQREARRHCIEQLVADIASAGHESLCLERDDSLAADDRRTISRKLRELSYADRLRYQHAKVATEPLLVIPDAIVWAWPQRDWRSACSTIVGEVKQV